MRDTGPARILIIDDDEMTRTIVRKMLEAAGFSVDLSPSGHDALVRVSESGYDAILCDMWMPGMTGKEFYQRLAEEFPDYPSRTVFLTGDIASEATWDFIEGGNLPYVLKPINIEELVQKLKQRIMTAEVAPGQAGPDKRRGRRADMKVRVWVRKKSATEDAEVAEVANASKESVYFLTSRQYSLGSEVLIAFPYTGTNDIEQKGYVVRVEKREDGQRGIAIALGEVAEAVGSVLTAYDAQRSQEPILDLAAWSSPAARPAGSASEETARVADLKLRLARARQEATFLVLELGDLKAIHERLAGRRQLLPGEETVHDWGLRELIVAESAIRQVVEDLKRQIQTLRTQVAAAQGGRKKEEKPEAGAFPGTGADTERRYTLTGLLVKEVASKLDQLWEQLKRDTPLRRQAQAAGIDLTSLGFYWNRDQAITVREEIEDPERSTVSMIASFPAKIGEELWRLVLLRRLQEETGGNALTIQKSA